MGKMHIIYIKYNGKIDVQICVQYISFKVVNLCIHTVRDTSCYKFTGSNNENHEKHSSDCHDIGEYLFIPRNWSEVRTIDDLAPTEG